MGEILQTRLIHLAGIALILLSLSPSPNNRVVNDHIIMARTAAMSGELEIALDHIEGVLNFYPHNDYYRISAGEIALALGDYRRALHHFNALAINLDEDPDLKCLLAELHLHLDDSAQALQLWKSSDYNCPSLDQTLYTLAQDRIEKDNFEEAEEILRALTQSQPWDSNNHLLLGMILATYDPEKALASLRIADDLSDNNNLDAQKLYRIIEEARAIDQPAYSLASVGQYHASIAYWSLSIRAFRNAINIQPDYADAYAYLGLARDQIGENGIVEFLKAVELAPDGSIPHLYLGMHWLNKNEFDMALNEFNRAAELDPSNPAVAAQIGAAYDAKGEINAAIQAYRAAAEMDRHDPTFWLLLALISLENEFQVGEIALPAARNAVALNPNDAAALDALGYSYYLLGDFNYAEKFILRSIQLEPLSAISHYHLGLLKTLQDEPTVALASFQLAYELDPDGGIGARAKRALETLAP